MKEVVKVSLVQFASEWLQLDKNLQRMSEFAEAEARAGQELIVFPELANIGYITPVIPGGSIDFEGLSYTQFASRYIRAAEMIPGPTTEELSRITKRYGVYVVVGLAQKHPIIPSTLYNSAVLIGPNGIIGVNHKMHACLAEKFFFYPGNTSEVFGTGLGNIGIVICYDARFPELSRILALKGAEIICCPWAIAIHHTSASPDFESFKHRSYMRAQENGVYFISCNRSGKQGDLKFMGRSAIASPNGTIIACSDTDEEEIIRAQLKEDELISYRGTLNIFRDRRPEMYGLICAPLSEPYRPTINSEQELRVSLGQEKELMPE